MRDRERQRKRQRETDTDRQIDRYRAVKRRERGGDR